MLPNTKSELDNIRKECYSMVTKRATISAGTSAVPVIGVDIAGDVAILLELIPSINRRFGLSNDQIDGYDPVVKQMIYQLIKRAGLAMIGQEITKTLVTQALKKIAGRAVVKQLLKFIPFAGWAANAAIGFGAMKYIGNSHVDDCYHVVERMMQHEKSLQ